MEVKGLEGRRPPGGVGRVEGNGGGEAAGACEGVGLVGGGADVVDHVFGRVCDGLEEETRVVGGDKEPGGRQGEVEEREGLELEFGRGVGSWA